MSVQIGFIACIENNKLTPEALLLFESIRQFGGKFASEAIYSYNPRGFGPLGPESYARLRQLSVSHSDQLLNDKYRHYPLANKIFAAAHAECHSSEEILVLLDSDSLLLNEPEGFLLPADCDVAVTPVWRTGIGSEGPDDPAEILWREMFGECGVRQLPAYVTTRLTGRSVRLYCNSGLVAVRRKLGIFSAWRHCFERVYASDRIRYLLNAGSEQFSSAGARRFFLEQAALSIALVLSNARIAWLDVLYNCPLHGRREFMTRYPSQRFDLDTVIHFHYRRACHTRDFFDQFQPSLNADSDQYKWLHERLPIEPVIENRDGSNSSETRATMAATWRKALREIEQAEGQHV